jgi:phosphatidylserine synthase 2
MGQHVWLLLATIITELLVIIKWSRGLFTEPMPGYIKVFLSTLAVLLVAYPAGKVSVPLIGGEFQSNRDH